MKTRAWFSSLFSPQFKSTPGECYSIRIGIGDKSKNFSDDYLDNLKIFLHEPNEFMYFIEQNDMPNSVKIDLKNLRLDEVSCKYRATF